MGRAVTAAREDSGDGFDIFEWAAEQKAAKTAEQTGGASTTTDGATAEPQLGTRYALSALEREAGIIAITEEGGRNDQMNRSAFKIGGYVNSGELNRSWATHILTRAGRACGLDDAEIGQCIASGFTGANTKGLNRTTPEGGDYSGIKDAYVLSGDTESPTAEDLHRLKVSHRAYELRVNEEGRLLYAAQQAAELNQKAPDPVNLTDFLAVPDEDATYRIDGLLPVGSRALFVAQYKTGKTTSIANLVRSLADGHPYLGRFAVDQVTKVTIIDTELDERMLRRWLRKQNIANRDRIQVLPMKGKLGTFDILDASTRASWARKLTGTDFVVLDCLRPCLDALGLSEDKDGGRFCVAWDALCAEAGVQESVVVHHAGHNSERSRGDSRLLDWPDVIWKLVKETQDGDEGSSDLANLHDGGKRFFSAHGRDVNIPECLLRYSPEDGSLTASDGNRGDMKAHAILPDLVEILSDPDACDGLPANAIEGRLTKSYGHSRGTARQAVRHAVKTGAVIVSRGDHNRQLHTLNPSHKTSI